MFVVNSGKTILSNQAWGQSSSSEDYVLDLFTNNVTVSDTTVASNLTPGSWTGYAQVSLPRSALTSSTLAANVAYLNTTVVPQWTNGSGGSVSVYGWMMRGASSGTLYAAQNFTGAPVSIPASNTLTLYPFQIGLESY
jgi:hypothetical protein